MSTTKKIAGLLLTTSTAFLTGVVAGMLLTPRSGKENRAWIGQKAEDATDWIDHQSKEALTQTEERLNHLKKDIQKNLKDSIPDLYEATEHLDLRDEELVNLRDDD